MEVMALNSDDRAMGSRGSVDVAGPAFDRLVEVHGSSMLRLCYVICGDAEMARDAVQDAWQRLWHSPPDLRDEARLRSWLLSVAANRARELARRTRRGSVLEQQAIRPGTLSDPGAGIEQLDLVRALDGLEPEARELIGLRYLLGWTSQEIGIHLGLSPEGVRSRLHRLMERLRTELDG